MNLSKIDRLVKYLKQPSTHKGLLVVASALGIAISPEHAEAIVIAGSLIYGLYQILRDEDKQIKDTTKY